MGLTNFILTCEKDNEELKRDINYYKNKASRLEKENQELKKQIEETDRKLFLTKNELDMREKTIDNKLNQQKEFIKWLENGIEKVNNTEFLDERIQRAGLIAYNRCLQKYKEIIGDDK